MMRLRTKYSKFIPAKDYTAITIFPYIIVRLENKANYNASAERHETTHALQQVECLVVGAILAVAMFFAGCGWWSLVPLGLFFELYVLEWAIKIPFCNFDTDMAYMSISTEREAYATMYDKDYNERRKHFAWLKYLFTLKPKKS